MMESILINQPDQLAEKEDAKREFPQECSNLADSQRSCIEEREHLQVYLRVRPFTSAESCSRESQDCISIEPPDTVLLRPPCPSLTARLSTERSLPHTGQRFQFSKVYGPETTQRELFGGAVKDLVKDVLHGGNSLVFTYGVTNAGKTFTFLGPDSDVGIVPRSLAMIFSSIGERLFSGVSIKPHRCREFSRLGTEQQTEEALFKRNLLRQLKENEKSHSSLLNSTNKTLLEGSCMFGSDEAEEEKITLNLETDAKFSVWVSFCEIYNENIHDLLEVAPGGAPRRTALRLSQDVKGNAFVKDLRWVQVSSAEEAYKVVKLGKRNQSFSFTRLNHLSSRSHSIFSIRILRIDDAGSPRVQAVSELCLCDLAGSERCAKTQNKGERLKEAGNINTSLLILGKCISALRHNQQAKLLQHVPFRESKLTHYLQGFFCGRGKACMVVNVNQCASMYDETLNVIKFSAVAQKVVVLSSRPLLPIMPQMSTSDASFIHDADRQAVRSSRRSSLIGWESSLEDVQEDEDDEEEQSLMEGTMDQTGASDESDDKITIHKKTHQKQLSKLKQLQVQLKMERADHLLMEARVREEISREFSELYTEMQNDYDERLTREREMLEERSEKRLEIFKNLINNMYAAGTSHDADAMDKLLDIHASEVAAHECLGSGQAVCQTSRDQEVEMKDQQNSNNSSAGEDEEKRRLLSELQEKTSEVSQLQEQLEKMVALKRRSELDGEKSSQLQEAVAALQKEKREREDALAALEYQTSGKEEALVSLDMERKAREEAVAALKQHEEKMMALLEEAKRDKDNVLAALEAERRANEEAAAALGQERQSKDEIQSSLAEERTELSRLLEENQKKQEEVMQLTNKLEAAERQVLSQSEDAEQLVQLQTAQTQLTEQSKEIQEKSCQIEALIQEVQTLKQEPKTTELPSDQVMEEVLELRMNLSEEKEKNQSTHKQMLEMERQLKEAQQQLESKHLVSDRQLQQMTEKLSQTEAASKQQVEELEKKLKEHQPPDELRCQQEASREEVEQLRAKFQDQTMALEKQMEQLNQNLQEQEVLSAQQRKELEQKLTEQKEHSRKLLDDLKQELSEQKKAAEQLEEAQLNATIEDERLRRMNSDLQAEVSSLKAKLSSVQETEETSSISAAEQGPSDTETVKLKEMEEKLVELQKTSVQMEAELPKKLLNMEAQLAHLQKSLKEAQDRREEEECRAVQEARRREVERRRELLAVAHEAIAQKDSELEKKAEEISRLKEDAKKDSEKLKSLGLDLQRKEDDSSDLREKLADYKKQMQQVQKEISSMREEEKVLRQKLTDLEKTKKQLQSDLNSRDRTVQQLKLEQSNKKSDDSLELYQKACKDLEAKERVMEDMRLALTEQEETQEQMEEVLEEKLTLIQELSSEVEKLKAELLHQDRQSDSREDGPSGDVKLAKEEASRAQESLKMLTEKNLAERRKWLEEKMSLIGQAKEAEDKRNQEMRKFAEDRERYAQEKSQLKSQIVEKEQMMDSWRKDRDTLVAALEVQLQKLLSSQAEKDGLIQQLRRQAEALPPEVDGGGPGVAELQEALTEKEAEIQRLQEELQASGSKQQNEAAQSKSSTSPAALAGKPQNETVNTRASVSSQASAGYPSVLESSEISTENGRTSRFPRPELEISFSPLQPNRMALRRHGDQSAVTVKITHSARKRKSVEMEKEEVEAENRRNTRTKLTPKLTPHKEESSSPAGCHDSQTSTRSRKEGTLQKIGDFLQSSPTLLGTKAKKMMSLVSGRADAESSASTSSSLRLRSKRKKKLYRPEISSPMDMPSHPMDTSQSGTTSWTDWTDPIQIISREPEVKESDHQIIKRRLRSRLAK